MILRAIRQLFADRLGLEPGEERLVAAMAALVAVLVGAFTVAKVLRDALFLPQYGAFSLPYGYLAVAAASGLLVAFDRGGTRGALRAQRVAIGAAIAAAALLPFKPTWLPALFYVWSGSQVTLVLSHFWLLALESWDARRARALFPMFTGAGLAGAVAGGAFASMAAGPLGLVGLMWALIAALVGAHALTLAIAHRRARRAASQAPFERTSTSTEPRLRILARSPYLRTLALALGLAVVVGTLVDFQFKVFAQRTYPDPMALAKFLGAFHAGLSALSLAVQFGVAGWVLRRADLGVTVGAQPATLAIVASAFVFFPVWWLAIAMRWIQGVLFQTLGKASSEIFYLAVRPPERKRVKPALDTLIERGADAAAGLLVLALTVGLGLGLRAVTVLTVVLAALWVAVAFALRTQYVDAFRSALAARWTEPELSPEALAAPGAIAALVEAMNSPDDARAGFAVRLAGRIGGPVLERGLRASLTHACPSVRAAALDGFTERSLALPEGALERALHDDGAGVREAAVRYGVTYGAHAAAFARDVLAGDDDALRAAALDALTERPKHGEAVVDLAWVDARIARGDPRALVEAAQGLALVRGDEADERLRGLLEQPLLDARRAALRALQTRPSPPLLDALSPSLLDARLASDARRAVVAHGDVAVPMLAALVPGTQGEHAQSVAARALAAIGTPAARAVLVDLATGEDRVARFHGLRGLERVRERTGESALSAQQVHALFAQEIAEVREHAVGGLAPEPGEAVELQLLGESEHELATRALDRARRALGVIDDPRALRGVYDALRAGRPGPAQARALEYLAQILPLHVFEPARKLFEDMPRSDRAPAAGARPRGDLEAGIRHAWERGDTWLRACAVRAARALGGIERAFFAGGPARDAEPWVALELARYEGDDER